MCGCVTLALFISIVSKKFSDSRLAVKSGNGHNAIYVNNKWKKKSEKQHKTNGHKLRKKKKYRQIRDQVKRLACLYFVPTKLFVVFSSFAFFLYRRVLYSSGTVYSMTFFLMYILHMEPDVFSFVAMISASPWTMIHPFGVMYIFESNFPFTQTKNPHILAFSIVKII